MSDPPPPARSFGCVADAYDRGRPTYPREAAVWLTAAEPLTVLELGAGTGKLTEQLVALGHDVHATEPDPAMLDVLRHALPDVRTSATGAEEIPAPDRSFDVVVAAQCFHWFDLDRALPEIARVLKPAGHLALVWNYRDDQIPWVKRLGDIIGTQDQGQQLRDPAEALVASALFGDVDTASYKFWQTVDRNTIQDLVLSRSNVATLDDDGRASKLAEVLALYDDYGRGMDGMQVLYAARCFRAPLVSPAEPAGLDIEIPGDTAAPNASEDDTGMLLIDFR